MWARYEAESTDLVTRNTYTQYTRMATNGLCGYVDIKMMIAPWFAWDEECTAEYYGMDLLNDANWLSYHPVPAVLTTQWSRKLELAETQVAKSCVFRYDGSHRRGLLITHENSYSKLEAIGTIDFDRYAPVVVYPDNNNEILRPMGMWVDCDPYITNHMTGAHAAQPNTVMMSATPALTSQSLSTEVIEPRRLYVLYSRLDTSSPEMTAIKVTDIQLPDPLSLDSIIRAAKNYLLYPALSAVMGFISGGPTGAVVAGASHLVSQAVKDLVPTQHLDVVKDVLDKTKTMVAEGGAAGDQ